MKQKILVTGGTGYIGSHTVVELQNSGYEVIIIDGGFNSWLNSVAQPRGFYSESFLENRNRK